MRPLHKTLSTLLVFSFAGSFAWADFATAFKAVPEDAVAVLTLKNLAEADRKVANMVKRLELGELAPVDDLSLVELLKEKMQPGEQFDANGSMTIAVLKPDNIMMLTEYVLILAPTKNGAKMLEDMQATKYPSGISEVVREGETAYALPMGSHVAYSPSQMLLESLAERESKKSLADHMSPRALKGMEDLDLVFWMNADMLIQTARPQINAFKPLLTMGTDPNDPFSVANEQQTMKSIDLFLDGVAGLSVGVGLHDDGIPLRMVLYAKPNTEMARRLEMTSKIEGVADLNGLPAGEYIAGLSSLTSPEAMMVQYDDGIAPFVAAARKIDELDQEQVNAADEALRAIITQPTSFRGVIHVLPENAQGVVGASMVIDMADSAAFCTAWGKFVDSSKAIVEGLTDGAFSEYLEPLAFKPEVGMIGELPYHTLGYDFGAVLGLEEEDIEDLEAIIGPDGMSLRLIPVNENRVAMVFGGGDSFAKQAAEAAASNEGPLAKDPGIKLAMTRMPKDPESIGFLAFDRLLTVFNRGALAIDEEPLPIEVPKLKEPFSAGSVSGESWARGDYFIPMDLIVAVKDASMAWMGMEGGTAPDVQDHGSLETTEE